MPERRYNDDEVAAIFARASEAEQAAQASPRQIPSEGGMTLAEVQSIGREAGIAPEMVTRAANELDRPPQPMARKFLGLPIGVARTVRLERRMTDAEGERLVVDLRETFDARGTVRVEGSFRTWANGNLQALVEPDGDGQRVRFRTVKGDARALLLSGLGVMGGAVVVSLSSMLLPSLGLSQAFASGGTLGLVGAGLFALGAIRLPGWARLRQHQMNELADRLETRR